MLVEQMISSTKLRKTESIAVSKKSQRSLDFKELLVEAIDATFYPLGDSSRRMFYFYLEKYFNMMKQDIPERIEEFAMAIERIFGKGAIILEIEIMKNLFVNIGSTFEYFPEKGDLLFVEYINAAREYVRTYTSV